MDLAALAAAFGLTFVIRFEGSVPAEYGAVLLLALPAVLLVKLVWLLALGVTRDAWCFVGLREGMRVFTALALASLLLVAWRSAAPSLGRLPLVPRHAPVPYGVLLIDLPLGFLGLMGLRLASRLWVECSSRNRLRGGRSGSVPTLLIGADRAGLLVAKEIAARPDTGLHALGFLDDDPGKIGSMIHGLPVLGGTDQLAEVVGRTGARQVLITLVDVPGARLGRIARACEACGIPARIIPEIHAIVGGKVNLSRLRDVAIEDVLRRPPVRLDGAAIAGIIRGRTVLITGAGGSIGSELCRVVCRFEPQVLVLVEKAENNLFRVNWQMAEEFPGVKVVPCLADICDGPRIEQVLSRHRPAAVFHAAAHKHVPLMEGNPGEAIRNNVLGTKKLADLAHSHGVGVFVMISTDKAVKPSSVMGVTKRVAELYVQALSQRSPTRFVAVRFGNVLGSAGSVVPIFKEQIARGGPVTVTHPEMERFFMTIPEACQLVLQAASMGRGGEIFILDMGKPVKIVDLARDLIHLSGLRPDQDVEILFTGIRPGEKLFEELSLREERAEKTWHPRIFVGRLQPQDWAEINRQVEALGEVVGSDPGRIRGQLREVVPEYQYTTTPPDDAAKHLRPDPPHERGGPAGTNRRPERGRGAAVGESAEGPVSKSK